MKALCLCIINCTGNPEGVRTAYQRGKLYEIDVDSPWAIHFRQLTSEEIAALEEVAKNASAPPKYLEPVERELVDDLLSKFRI